MSKPKQPPKHNPYRQPPQYQPHRPPPPPQHFHPQYSRPLPPQPHYQPHYQPQHHPLPQRNYQPRPSPSPSPSPPPPPPPPPPPRRRPKPLKGGRTRVASCIVATIFLLFLVIILFIVYFSLFKPKDPKISVTAIQLPTFTLSSNATAVSFTFSLYAAVRNPNRGAFSHFDSSLQLLYLGNQVGFMFIPAGSIAAGRTEYMTATFSVQAFPISASPAANIPAMVGPAVTDGVSRVSPTMELEARMEMEGRVRVLWVFNHEAKDVADCRVAVAITDGSVLGFHC